VGDYPANWNAVQDVPKKAQLLAMQNDVKKRAAQYLLRPAPKEVLCQKVGVYFYSGV
jgi:hypothetical protein